MIYHCGQTSIIGATCGSRFSDLHGIGDNGNFFLNQDGKAGDPINLDKPFQKISIYYERDYVDGIEVTYNVKRASVTNATRTITHGSKGKKTKEVVFNENEVLICVHGRTGVAKEDGRVRILQIGFVIFNTSTGAISTSGPFGSEPTDKLDSKAFRCADPLAFGGYAITDATGGNGHSELGGLFFYKAST